MQDQIPSAIRNSLQDFIHRYPSQSQTAFLMMRFIDRPVYTDIHHAVVMAFNKRGIAVTRADDTSFHADLWPNIQTYLHGCGIGVAVFDRIETEEHNPNVSLEVGYMMAQDKPLCILKERTLRTVPTDILSRVYEQFDIHDAMSSIDRAVARWLERNRLVVPATVFRLQLEGSGTGLSEEAFRSCVAGLMLYSQHSDWIQPAFRGFEASDFVTNTTTAVMSGDIRFFQHLTALHKAGNLSNLCGFKVNDVSLETSSVNAMVDYLWHDTRSRDRVLYQICRLSAFEGFQSEAEKGSKLVGDSTLHFDQIVVWIKRIGDFWYFHSNYQHPIWTFAAKVRALRPRNLFGVLQAITGAIHREFSSAEQRQLFASHVQSIRYLFDEQSLSHQGFPPFDLAGAIRTERI